ncbi:hypothetical protein DXG01_009997 [Tephrocybe rancida]|nr:hypothetical protein DXG01_009997 [Tephrocybe rancida]
MSRVITIAALAGFVSASSYSIGCMNSLLAIGQNAEAQTCLKPAQLLPVLIGAGNGPESVIGYMDTWLGSMCGAPACSDDTLYLVLNNLTRDCSDEFGLGGTAPEMQKTIATLQAGYKTARKVACLKDTNSGGINCVTGSLRNIETLTGALNLNDTNILSIASYVKKGFPKSVVCTNCIKAAYSLIVQALPGSFSDSDTKSATKLCGAAFADGGIPPGIVSTAFEAAVIKGPTTATPVPTTTSTSTPTPKPTWSTATLSPTPTPTPTSTKKKNSALGRGSVLSCSAFMVISGLVAVGVGMVPIGDELSRAGSLETFFVTTANKDYGHLEAQIVQTLFAEYARHPVYHENANIMHQEHTIPWNAVVANFKYVRENRAYTPHRTSIFARQLPTQAATMNHFKRVLHNAITTFSETERKKYDVSFPAPTSGALFSDEFRDRHPEFLDKNNQSIEYWIQRVSSYPDSEDLFYTSSDGKLADAVKALVSENMMEPLLMLAHHPQIPLGSLRNVHWGHHFGFSRVMESALHVYIEFNMWAAMGLLEGGEYLEMEDYKWMLMHATESMDYPGHQVPHRAYLNTLPKDAKTGRPVVHHDLAGLKEYLKTNFRLLYQYDMLVRECGMETEWEGEIAGLFAHEIGTGTKLEYIDDGKWNNRQFV